MAYRGRGEAAADPVAGLTSDEASRRLALHGENRINTGHRISPARILLRQFYSPLVLILVLASALAAMLGEVIDAVAILTIVVLNGILGFVQEWRAERALEALRDMLAPMAEVIRDGQPSRIEAAALVPGDLVMLSEGQKVPADIDLSEAQGLRIDESALTGESVPVSRGPGDDTARVLMGTLVVGGRGRGLVAATGPATRFGQIAELTGQAGETATRLQRQLGSLSRRLGLYGLLVAAAILGLGLLSGRAFVEMLLTSVSIAVAVVPEGLPLVVTLTLAIGASTMARQKALLRRLQAAETLGAASVICTDKTGTLTENKMTVTRLLTLDRAYEVSGLGYDPAGDIQDGDRAVEAGDDPALWRLLHAGAACNDARLVRNADWQLIGDPTEGALITLVHKAQIPVPDPQDRVAELPFSSERKRMAVLAPRPDGRLALFVKGAPEAVLEASASALVEDRVVPLDRQLRAELVTGYETLASQGLRVIAIADRDAGGHDDLAEEGLIFLGFAGLLDPPRAEVADAVRLCHDAGVRIVMITGDSAATAAAVADMVGIRHGAAITGEALEHLSDEALGTALSQDVLFARTTPAHKMRIVAHLQGAGDIVAMTGDGVNDAPALRRADVGMAMGTRGTDVAKEAADLVILDDNFATIVRAISEGRRQFANIRKFVRYLLSSNSAEVIALGVNLLVGGPIILFPVHILWINLLTDGISAVALGLEPAEPEQMQTPPLSPDERVLTTDGFVMLAGFGVYMAAACLAMFYGFLDQGEGLARTMAFTTLVFCQEIAVFAFRSDYRSSFRLGVRSNPWLFVSVGAMLGLQVLAIYWPPLQTLLGTVPLDAREIGLALIPAIPVAILPTVLKALRRKAESW